MILECSINRYVSIFTVFLCPPKQLLKPPTTVAKPYPSESWFIEKNIHYLGCVLTRLSFSCQMIFYYKFLWTCKKLTPQPMVAPPLLPGTWFEKTKTKNTWIFLPWGCFHTQVSYFLAKWFREENILTFQLISHIYICEYVSLYEPI